MKKLYTLLFSLSILSAIAQHKCGADEIHKDLMQNDPVYRMNQQLLNEATLRAKANPSLRNEETLTIPLVVHIIHLGEEEGTGTNISDAQVNSAIDNLNDFFANTHGESTEMNVQFELAKWDPNCNPTNGINRVDGSSTSNYATYGIERNNGYDTTSQNYAVRNLSRWSNASYYNIWIVSEIEGNDGGAGTQGFATLPGGTAINDGAVMLYNAFGYDPEGTLGYNLKFYTNKNTTLIHEIGHGMNLYHTFEGDDGGGTCPADLEVGTSGDGCDDTQPHSRDDGGGSEPSVGSDVTCHGETFETNTAKNIMSYYDNETVLTADQKLRVRTAIQEFRSSLLDSKVADENFEGFDGTITAASCFPSLPDIQSNVSGIQQVKFAGINYSSGYPKADGGSIDLTGNCLIQGEVEKGKEYEFFMTYGYAKNTQQYAVFLDYNGDGDFDDSGETLAIETGISSDLNSDTITNTFTISNNAVGGSHIRMRVMIDYYWNSAIQDACHDIEYGQVEDYLVYVKNPTDLKEEAIETKQFTLYPNPAKDQITVTGEGNVSIFSIEGKLHLQAPAGNIEISALPSGIYLVENGFSRERLVVE